MWECRSKRVANFLVFFGARSQSRNHAPTTRQTHRVPDQSHERGFFPEAIHQGSRRAPRSFVGVSFRGSTAKPGTAFRTAPCRQLLLTQFFFTGSFQCTLAGEKFGSHGQGGPLSGKPCAHDTPSQLGMPRGVRQFVCGQFSGSPGFRW